MNLILTTKCNNHCSYCFQKPLRNENNNEDKVSIEKIIKILNWAKLSPSENINILGGEVTLLPNLKEILDKILEFYPDNKIFIITNLLGSQKNINYLKELLEKKKIILMINTTTDNNKKDKFLKNLKLIKNNSNLVSLGITLTDIKEENIKNINNLNKIFRDFPEFNVLRVGLKTPIMGESISKIYNYDEDFKYLINTLPNIFLHFDCPTNYCQLSYDLRKYYELRSTFCCDGGPIDILMNYSCRFCFSSSDDFKVESIFNFKDYYDLKNFFIIYNKKYLIKNHICLNCDKYLNNSCFPCHSFDEALLRGEND